MPRRRVEDNIKTDVKVHDRPSWIGFLWSRIGTSGGLW